MVRTAHGDLLSAETDALVNTVNTVGVMGKGIALQFKKRFPGNFKAYAAACKAEQVQLGRMFVYDSGSMVTKPRWIINFPTKAHWRSRSRLEDVATGLDDLARVIVELGITSIAVPPLDSYAGRLWDYWERNLDPDLFKDRSLGGAIGGKLGDVHGHRRIYRITLFAVAVFTAMSALAWNGPSFLAVRVLAGLAAGATSANSTAGRSCLRCRVSSAPSPRPRATSTVSRPSASNLPKVSVLMPDVRCRTSATRPSKLSRLSRKRRRSVSRLR